MTVVVSSSIESPSAPRRQKTWDVIHPPPPLRRTTRGSECQFRSTRNAALRIFRSGFGNSPLTPVDENAPIRHIRVARVGDAMTERVLIVDDDPVQRRLIENMVNRFGYEAVVVDGGDAAMAMLAGAGPSPIDCVVLDLVMPD